MSAAEPSYPVSAFLADLRHVLDVPADSAVLIDADLAVHLREALDEAHAAARVLEAVVQGLTLEAAPPAAAAPRHAAILGLTDTILRAQGGAPVVDLSAARRARETAS